MRVVELVHRRISAGSYGALLTSTLKISWLGRGYTPGFQRRYSMKEYFIHTALLTYARVTLPLEAGVYTLPNHEVRGLECAR
jgi:hypothetical protein